MQICFHSNIFNKHLSEKRAKVLVLLNKFASINKCE
jgi:hypothetical protein